MAEVTVDRAKLLHLLNEEGGQVARGLKRRVERAADFVRQEAPEFSGQLVDRIQVRFRNRAGQFGVEIVVEAPYALFVINGRAPGGKFPPYSDENSDFVQWANAKGMDPYLLARHIQRNGIQPNDFLTRGVRAAGSL